MSSVRLSKTLLCALALIVLAGPGPIAPDLAAQNAARSQTRVPDWSEQLAIRERLLVERHKLILPMMRRHGIAMWIVVNEEFHDDPVISTIAPPRPYAGNRDFFVFVDDGTAALRAFALTSYPEENLQRFFEPMADGRNARAGLTALYERFKPKTIGLALDGSRGVTRGLTHATYL